MKMDVAEARSVLESEADLLTTNGLDLLEDVYYAEGKGDGWLFCEPRYHMWKGIDELFTATHHIDEGQVPQFDDHTSHGLNHIWMASYIAHGGGLEPKQFQVSEAIDLIQQVQTELDAGDPDAAMQMAKITEELLRGER